MKWIKDKEDYGIDVDLERHFCVPDDWIQGEEEALTSVTRRLGDGKYIVEIFHGSLDEWPTPEEFDSLADAKKYVEVSLRLDKETF